MKKPAPSRPAVPPKGPRHPRAWRTLEESEETDELPRRVTEEFPEGFDSALDRRTALAYLAAPLALAGLSGCESKAAPEIVPYVRQPEQVILGKPLYFATAVSMGSSAIGVLCETHEGRPVKIEGNPDHPASLGSTDIFAQAEVLSVWDPERARTVEAGNQISSWGAFDSFIRQQRAVWRGSLGRGLRILTPTVLSPTLADQIRGLIAQFPEARWVQYEPLNRDSLYEGTRRLFGRPLHPTYRLEQADVIVSLDSDFLRFGPGCVAYAKQFAKRRSGEGEMNRLYAAEPMPTTTGAMADHRLPFRRSRIERLARALAGSATENLSERAERWISGAAADLAASNGRCLILAGEQQPPETHALAHELNVRFGAVGTTLSYTEPIEPQPARQLSDFVELVEEMRTGEVETLAIIGGNPVYASPLELDFAAALERVPTRIRLGLYHDETSELCQWRLPETHFLEHWSDLRTYDGSASIVQPLIEPLDEGRSAHQVLASMSGEIPSSGRDLIRDFWRRMRPGEDFEGWWRRGLYRGVLEGTSLPPQTPQPTAEGSSAPSSEDAAEGIEIDIGPDPTIYDGRYARNGWLQELPKPIVSLTWSNAAYLSVETARRLGVVNGDVVRVRAGERSVEAPVWITPGHVDDAATLHLGYGTPSAGAVRGFNAFALLSAGGGWAIQGAELTKLSRHVDLAERQSHQQMENRDLVVSASLERFRREPGFVSEIHPAPPPEQTLLPSWPYDGYKWGMAIDLSACMGCAACTIACQAENNIPVVGPEQVAANRSMHWIRVDYYFQGEPSDPEILPQPVPCMHCENAPCEVVCPVGATVHSAEGLNQMVYNRCVGTRYCSNNCPYKVRRFNFLDYSGEQPETYNGRMNPDVTVRRLGVMEKCTYCVQRIEEARITARKEERAIRDGEIITACQQVCPADAIVFGDWNDPDSRLSRAKASPRDYGLLLELNTRPRTSYAVRLKNRNDALGEGDA